MLQVRVHGPADVRVDEIDEPRPGPRDAVVRIAACGICGTDLSYIKLGGPGGPVRSPMCIGHEMAGVVDWVGGEVDGVRTGDRVVVHPGDPDVGYIGNGGTEGGLTPRLHVREAARGGRLFPVPGDLPLDVAALAEPLAVGMHAVDQADVVPSERVAVFGCGPIGLAAIATMVDRGVDGVVAVDLSATRRELAAELGARAVLDPGAVDVWDELARLHGTKPFMFGPTPATDAFIEASGSDRVIGDIVDHAGENARLSIVALHFAPVPTNYLAIMMKQLTIRGSINYPPRFEDAIDLLARRDLSALVTHRFPLDRFHDALATLGGSKDCGKVMVTMDDSG